MTKEVISAKREKTGTITNPDTDRIAMEKMVVSRIAMLSKTPFWGNIATRLILKEISPNDGWNMTTAATDGKYLYYNAEFITKLKDREVVFLVGHELLHCIYEHVGLHGRCGNRNKKMFNIAADFAINRDLIDYKIGDKITTVPCLYDKKYDGMSAEEIYESLYENAEKIDIDGLGEMLLDIHLDDDGDGEGEGEGGRQRMTAEEKAALADEIKEAMLSAAQAVGIGNVPQGMKRFIDGLTEPKMNWQEVIRQSIESQVKNDFTFMKPSRRGWSCDAILPSMKKEPAIECTIAIDLSGSIGQTEMKDFFSEIAGIMEQHASYKITLLTWDTNCYLSGIFTEDDGVDEMLKADMKGGGGTDPTCIWQFIEEQEIETKQLLIFTDGYVSSWGDEYSDRFPTTWLMYKNPSAVASHGDSIYYD